MGGRQAIITLHEVSWTGSEIEGSEKIEARKLHVCLTGLIFFKTVQRQWQQGLSLSHGTDKGDFKLLRVPKSHIFMVTN